MEEFARFSGDRSRIHHDAEFGRRNGFRGPVVYGAIIVAITRLVPLFPFNLLNYGFGLTRVPFWTYVGWSWLCMLPGTILYVLGADALTQGLTRGEIPWPLVVAFAAIAVILTLLVRRARHILQKKERRKEAD